MRGIVGILFLINYRSFIHQQFNHNTHISFYQYSGLFTSNLLMNLIRLINSLTVATRDNTSMLQRGYFLVAQFQKTSELSGAGDLL